MITTESGNPSLTPKPPAPQPAPAVKFGTDGWRGVIGRDYTFENVRVAARATALAYAPQAPAGTAVPVGYDHRFLAEEFALEAAKVLAASGLKPLLLSEAVTSPLLSYITWKLKAPFGVMITASHNPPEYLGFKVKGSFGGSIPPEAVEKIEKQIPRAMAEGGLDLERIKITPADLKPFLDDYFEYFAAHIDFSLFKKPLPVAIECLYGPGGKIAEALFKKKGKIKLSLLHNHRDALFGGLHPEPIEEYLAEFKAFVKKTRPAGGFALDGDADRLGMVDEKGRYLTPQQVFALLLYYLAHYKKLSGRVVQAVSLGYLSERIAKDLKLPFTEVPVGFKHVAKELLKGGVLIGGEESGGYAFGWVDEKTKGKTLLPERDGLFSTLLFIEMMLRTGKTVSALLSEVEKRYGASRYLRFDAPLSKPIEDKEKFISGLKAGIGGKWLGVPVKEIRTLDGLKVVLEDGSWVLVRPSGTEPLLRTYAESPETSFSKKCLDEMYRLARGLMQ